MDKIKYENVKGNYKNIEDFYRDCRYKDILLGAFCITEFDYKYNTQTSYSNSDNNLVIHYIVFDPTKHNVTHKVIVLPIGENERVNIEEMNRVIQGYEYRELHYYLKRHHKNSKINCINEIFEVEYL